MTYRKVAQAEAGEAQQRYSTLETNRAAEIEELKAEILSLTAPKKGLDWTKGQGDSMATSYVKDLKRERKYTIELRARIRTLEAGLPDAPKQAAEVKDSPETTEKLAQAKCMMQGRKRTIEDLKIKVSNLEARARELSSMAEGEKVDAANQIIAHAAAMDRALLMYKCGAREQSIKKDWQSFMPGHLKDRERNALENGKTCKELAGEVAALTKELRGQKEERKGLEKRVRELTKGTKWETENKTVPSGTDMKRSSELPAKRQKVEA